MSFLGFGCEHEWEVIAKTYAPPREANAATDCGDIDILRFTERAECGVTTVLMVCACCGETDVTEMLGKDASG